MKGTVVAVNRRLGVLVVETEAHNCVVLQTRGRLTFSIGETVIGDWHVRGDITVHNLARGTDILAQVQKTGASRGEAVSSMAVI